LSRRKLIVDYDPRWPELYEHEADRIQVALDCRTLRIEHVGLTSVPGLVAKSIIDILRGSRLGGRSDVSAGAPGN
jgi:GrpB-like predicted nucleotidyltransferase (UPF0157 family)